MKDNFGWWGRKGGGNSSRKVLVRAAVIFAKDSIGRVTIIFGRKSKCADLSEILCCLVGGWDISVRFTLMSRGDLTYLAGLLHFVIANQRLVFI